VEKCGRKDDEKQIFDKITEPNVVSYTTSIAGHVQHGNGEHALKVFRQMQKVGFKPNDFTFSNILSACASQSTLVQGKKIHTNIIKFGHDIYFFAQNALITMHSKYGSIESAKQVFDKIHVKDSISWNSMMARYVGHGFGKVVIYIFE